MRFEWDQRKAAANARKHGVTFSEAVELFQSGVDYLEIFDEEHSDEEERFLAVGPLSRGLVVVVWTERADDVVRVIGARWATKREVALFREHMGR